MLPTKLRFIWPSIFRGEDLKKSVNQKQELPVMAMFVTYNSPRPDRVKQKTMKLIFVDSPLRMEH